MNKKLFCLRRRSLLGSLSISLVALSPTIALASTLDISQIPLMIGSSSTPLVMLVMGRDHKLYYEAYNDASDLNGDGVLDITYKPDKIEYFGLFDSSNRIKLNTSAYSIPTCATPMVRASSVPPVRP